MLALLTSQVLLSFVLLSFFPLLASSFSFLPFFSFFHLYYSDAKWLRRNMVMNAGPMYYLLDEILLGEVFNFSMCQFSSVQIGAIAHVYHSAGRTNETIHVKSLK